MLNRRTFIQRSLLTYASLKMFEPVNSFASQNNKSFIAICESKNHRKAVRHAVQMSGGMEKFISKGDKVALKPNMAWAKKPEYAANTNPEVVAEVVKLCYEAGADTVYVTDNPCNSPRSVYALSQIPSYAQKEGAEIFIPQNRHFKDMSIGGKFVDNWSVLEIFHNADKVINIPVAKDHGSSRITVSMKNWLGAVGGSRGALHQNLHQAIADLAAFFKPTLNIVDCTRILMCNGPTGGSLDYVKKLDRIIVSSDQVAVDTIASEYLGTGPENVQFIRIAEKSGLGTSQKNKMNIVYDKI